MKETESFLHTPEQAAEKRWKKAAWATWIGGVAFVAANYINPMGQEENPDCAVTAESFHYNQDIYESLRTQFDRGMGWDSDDFSTIAKMNDLEPIDDSSKLNALYEATEVGAGIEEQVAKLNDITEPLGFPSDYEEDNDSIESRQDTANEESQSTSYKYRLGEFARNIQNLPYEFFENVDISQLTFEDHLASKGRYRRYGIIKNTMTLNAQSEHLFPTFIHEAGHGFDVTIFSTCPQGHETFKSFNPEGFNYTGRAAEEGITETEKEDRIKRQAEAYEKGIVVSEYAATSLSEDIADTFEAFVDSSGIDLIALKNAPEIQRNKFYTLMTMIGEAEPDLANYLIDIAEVGLMGGLEPDQEASPESYQSRLKDLAADHLPAPR